MYIYIYIISLAGAAHQALLELSVTNIALLSLVVCCSRIFRINVSLPLGKVQIILPFFLQCRSRTFEGGPAARVLKGSGEWVFHSFSYQLVVSIVTGVPNSWMVYNGKSWKIHLYIWFGGTPFFKETTSWRFRPCSFTQQCYHPRALRALLTSVFVDEHIRKHKN